jgi:secreted PhoX family phosphatase
MSVDRRTVIKSSAAVAAAGPFAGLVATPPASASHTVPLGAVPDLRDGKVRLHLPEGFKYRSFHDTEQPVFLTDGTRLPGRHDGMGAFAGPEESVILVRNHELLPPSGAFGPGTPYDAAAAGGTTTIHVTKKGKVIRSFTSLNGTVGNCSGGIMPWGSWVTCEETINGPDVGNDFQNNNNALLQQKHGYVFEVPASRFPGSGQSTRTPIRSAGRFSHEAVSYDPDGGHLYLTEDDFGFASGFYRYAPPADPMEVGELRDGGTLQMLRVVGTPNAHLEGAQVAGTVYAVDWVDIDFPDPTFPAGTTNNQALTGVASQGWAKGAALFSRLEGQHYDNGIVYFTSTQGGGDPETSTTAGDGGGFGNGWGQVWAYDTAAETLRVVFQSPNRDVLDLPDNITTSRQGTLVVCEDNTMDNYIRGLTTEGHLWNIALNRLKGASGNDRSGDEFAGSTFSPDGHTLFVNIQASNGMTFAIWGPWESIGV